MTTLSKHSLIWLGVLILFSSCSPAVQTSSYRVQLPVLRAKPQRLACEQDPDQGCIALLYSDFVILTRELAAACLSLGGTRKECGLD